MKKLPIILLGLCIALFSGCFKDKGNYDLRPINEIAMRPSVGDTIVMQQFDTLRIAMRLEQSMPADESQFTYRWNVYPYPNGGTNLDLGDGRDLAAPIGLKPGKYRLQYTITAPQTDIPYIKTFLLEVTGLLGEGWLVLEQKADGTQDVNIITPQDRVIRDLYQTANGTSFPEGTHRLHVMNASIFQYIFAYGTQDAVQVDPNSFGRLNGLADWFFQSGKSGTVNNHFVVTYGFGSFLMLNGELYAEPNLPNAATQYGAPIRGDWELSKYVIQMDFNGQSIFFDNKHQRFLLYASNRLNGFSNPAEQAFDMNNVDKQLVYAGPSLSSYYNCVMKDNDADRYYVYRINYLAAVPAAETYTIDDAPDFAQATAFASSKLYYHIYYAAGNKLYLLDIPARRARLVYTFPVGETIKTLKLKQSMAMFELYDDNNKTLGVATEDNGQGKLYEFSISNTGDFEDGKYKRLFDGFGSILDLTYKNKPF